MLNRGWWCGLLSLAVGACAVDAQNDPVDAPETAPTGAMLIETASSSPAALALGGEMEAAGCALHWNEPQRVAAFVLPAGEGAAAFVGVEASCDEAADGLLMFTLDSATLEILDAVGLFPPSEANLMGDGGAAGTVDEHLLATAGEARVIRVRENGLEETTVVRLIDDLVATFEVELEAAMAGTPAADVAGSPAAQLGCATIPYAMSYGGFCQESCAGCQAHLAVFTDTAGTVPALASMAAGGGLILYATSLTIPYTAGILGTAIIGTAGLAALAIGAAAIVGGAAYLAQRAYVKGYYNRMGPPGFEQLCNRWSQCATTAACADPSFPHAVSYPCDGTMGLSCQLDTGNGHWSCLP